MRRSSNRITSRRAVVDGPEPLAGRSRSAADLVQTFCTSSRRPEAGRSLRRRGQRTAARGGCGRRHAKRSPATLVESAEGIGPAEGLMKVRASGIRGGRPTGTAWATRTSWGAPGRGARTGRSGRGLLRLRRGSPALGWLRTRHPRSGASRADSAGARQPGCPGSPPSWRGGRRPSPLPGRRIEGDGMVLSHAGMSRPSVKAGLTLIEWPQFVKAGEQLRGRHGGHQ